MRRADVNLDRSAFDHPGRHAMHNRRNNLAKRPIASIAACLLIAIALPAASVGQDVSSEPVRGVDDPELTELLELVGERVREYYRDLENLAWTTTVRHEVFEDDWSPKEEPKDLVFESIVLLETPPDDVPVPFFVREASDLSHVDGASVDPGYELESDFLYRYQLPELLMLLPEYRATSDRVFSYAGRTELEGRPAFVVDVEQPRSPDDEPRIVWRGRRFSIYNLVFTRRIWIDPETYDVLRFDTEAEPVSFRRSLIFGRIGYEQTSTTRYTTVAFDDTEMEFLVPESYEYVRIIEGARIRPITRTRQSYSNYRRFAGDVRLDPSEGQD